MPMPIPIPVPSQPLRIAVLGAGALGSYVGARLAQAGQQVVLIGREAHVQATLRKHILCVFIARGPLEW